MSEPPAFVQDVSREAWPFYTTGFQEDHAARKNGVFTDDEFLRQATYVLEERLRLFEYAVENYDDGLLFFYFSSSDLQSHMFWWNSDDPHPTRTPAETTKYFAHIKRLYQKLDSIIGDIHDRYGGKATIFVMSDHGFANFGRQFNLNSWLRDFGFLNPGECTSILSDVDWSRTRAYGLGINGLYLNLKGREPNGIVEPGEEQEKLLKQLVARLKAVRDTNGEQVIRNVYRADQIYSGNATEFAPDLIVGYKGGYRASWETCQGVLTPDVLLDNPLAWSADHCTDALEVPGVLCCNRPIKAQRAVAHRHRPLDPRGIRAFDTANHEWQEHFCMSKINIDSALYERAKQAAAVAGFSSLDEFVASAIENELKRLKVEDAEQQVSDQLRGLGYIE